MLRDYLFSWNITVPIRLGIPLSYPVNSLPLILSNVVFDLFLTGIDH